MPSVKTEEIKGMRKYFIWISVSLLTILAVFTYFYPSVWWLFLIFAPLIVIGFYDIFQKEHAILRNFPIIGHMRYLLESISPEIQQYFIETNSDGRPFNRLQRNFVYKHAKNTLSTHPFGTELNLYEPGHYWIGHSMYPKEEMGEAPRVRFGGKSCSHSYSASIFNVSAMSFGSLGRNAVSSLCRGAKKGNFYVNTGEGGIASYHLDEDCDLVWQIGTAYFGCRTEKGEFSESIFHEKACHPNVKMIEVKLSQGAKPGLGGLLPAEKNTPEIAKIRGLIPHKMVHSPPAHKAFNDAEGLLHFIKKLRMLSGGKPVGFKMCLGSRQEFLNICKAILKTKIFPDFITIDGSEGGTGAAPIEFSDNVGMPLNDALVFVVDSLRGYGIRNKLRVIATGKVVTDFDIVRLLSIGADAVNGARSMLFAIGCIQAMRCDTNNCPTGITTQREDLQKGLVVKDKAERVCSYHEETVKSALSIITAAGLDKLSQLNRSYIYKRVDEFNSFSLSKLFPDVEYGSYLKEDMKAEGEERRRNKEGQGIRRQAVDAQKEVNNYPKEKEKEKENIP